MLKGGIFDSVGNIYQRNRKYALFNLVIAIFSKKEQNNPYASYLCASLQRARRDLRLPELLCVDILITFDIWFKLRIGLAFVFQFSSKRESLIFQRFSKIVRILIIAFSVD